MMITMIALGIVQACLECLGGASAFGEPSKPSSTVPDKEVATDAKGPLLTAEDRTLGRFSPTGFYGEFALRGDGGFLTIYLPGDVLERILGAPLGDPFAMKSSERSQIKGAVLQYVAGRIRLTQDKRLIALVPGASFVNHYAELAPDSKPGQGFRGVLRLRFFGAMDPERPFALAIDLSSTSFEALPVAVYDLEKKYQLVRFTKEEPLFEFEWQQAEHKDPRSPGPAKGLSKKSASDGKRQTTTKL